MKDRITAQILSAFLLAIPVLAASPRDIEFAGITWGLRQNSRPANPGPTAFSNAEDQAWVDEAGKLHITLQKRGQNWTGSELMAKEDAEYGTYRFDAEGSLHGLDPNIVFGFFTWDSKAADTFNREIDIEIASWNQPGGNPVGSPSSPMTKPETNTPSICRQPRSIPSKCAGSLALSPSPARLTGKTWPPGVSRVRFPILAAPGSGSTFGFSRVRPRLVPGPTK